MSIFLTRKSACMQAAPDEQITRRGYIDTTAQASLTHSLPRAVLADSYARVLDTLGRARQFRHVSPRTPLIMPTHI